MSFVLSSLTSPTPMLYCVLSVPYFLFSYDRAGRGVSTPPNRGKSVGVSSGGAPPECVVSCA